MRVSNPRGSSPFRCPLFASILLILLASSGCSWTELVTLDSTGAKTTGSKMGPTVSLDGRYVAFHSGSNTLVPNDTNFQWDVFVRDTLLGTTTRVSVDSAGNQSEGGLFESLAQPGCFDFR